LAAGVSGSWDWAAAGSNAAVTKTIKISFSRMILTLEPRTNHGTAKGICQIPIQIYGLFCRRLYTSDYAIARTH
jgi:hypothetical protein